MSLAEVFSSGGGTQSTAIAVLIIQGKLPKPDFVVIADTGRECQTTWDYLDTWVRPGLEAVGVEVHRIGPEWQSVPEHGKNYVSHNGATLIIPVFTDKNGGTGKFTGYCSNRWKIETISRYLSKKCGITRSKYRTWIGFSADEWKRAQRLSVSPEGLKGLIRFPLIQDVYLKRHESVLLVERHGWPTPPRSRCWMCPNQNDDSWRSLSPGELQAAAAFEREVQEFDPHTWLHRKCRPIDQIDFTKEPELFDEGGYCTSGSCFI